MANLRDRLKRIQDSKNTEPQREKKVSLTHVPVFNGQNWEPCGFNVLKREVIVKLPFTPVNPLPSAVDIIIPDLEGRVLPLMEDFLFFDLETTGLSGGAGTVAFLAAFGNIMSTGRLRITQYLLLDYSGQIDFLAGVLSEFKNEKSVIVSYNGKCFDSYVLKTMCLMNRVRPPEYRHADLLHPARRLWKKITADCSQGSIETNILGLDRTGDIPGSLAPEIWFDFLKTGNTQRLMGICDHNKADITGLASILNAMILIAEDPFNINKYNYDTERLAVYVYKYAYRQMKMNNYREPLDLINKGLNVLERDSYWYNKMCRRKKRIEKIISRKPH